MNGKNIDATDILVRNPDVILREEDPDGALLFNPDTNQILGKKTLVNTFCTNSKNCNNQL